MKTSTKLTDGLIRRTEVVIDPGLLDNTVPIRLMYVKRCIKWKTTHQLQFKLRWQRAFLYRQFLVLVSMISPALCSLWRISITGNQKPSLSTFTDLKFFQKEPPESILQLEKLYSILQLRINGNAILFSSDKKTSLSKYKYRVVDVFVRISSSW